MKDDKPAIQPLNGQAQAEPEQHNVKMTPKQAIAIMSEGFISAMRFLQEHGAPQDLMIEAMRIGQKHGLCARKDGFGLDGKPTMQYVNPYVSIINPAPKIITETDGNA